MGHKVKKPRDCSQFKNPGGRRSPKYHKVKTQLGNYIIPHRELWPVPQTPELEKERYERIQQIGETSRERLRRKNDVG